MWDICCCLMEYQKTDVGHLLLSDGVSEDRWGDLLLSDGVSEDR